MSVAERRSRLQKEKEGLGEQVNGFGRG
ncbi:uncharacterized protein G2W53_043330 [Senna tora]|uniref:Uncharacterized protein n=1 Tax=Senna tora TaxID=362788 RepID=A0A834SIJ8_9FABA|nr:uncharacterized protein G2W53_043330 [Senna tora]